MLEEFTGADRRDSGLTRLESKVDKIADAVQKLVLIEERQTTQGDRIGRAEAATSRLEGAIKTIADAQRVTDRKVDMWVQRGVAAWAVVSTLAVVAKALHFF